MKKRLFTLFLKLGVTRLAAWHNRRRVVILCYHGVTARERRMPEDPTGLHIRFARFEAQLDYLRRNFRVVSLGEYLRARHEGRELPDYTAVITFDDGYRNFYTMAAPRLRERGLPASLFLTVGKIKEERRGDGAWSPEDDVEYLSWPEVVELKGGGVEVGSHTITHPMLSQLPLEEAERELRESFTAVAGRTGDERPPFAYPFGDYTPEVAERARTLGYSCALTTDAGANDPEEDLYTLRRVLIGDDDDEPAFAARVSGLTALLSRALPA
jgi:peptidoglycan/xylan/chitin deacetylase (PgdA/CDA1 family)